MIQIIIITEDQRNKVFNGIIFDVFRLLLKNELRIILTPQDLPFPV
jgi:hypothetical protein